MRNVLHECLISALEYMQINKISPSPLPIFLANRIVLMVAYPVVISSLVFSVVFGSRAEIRPSNYHEGPQVASQYIQISNHVERSESFPLKSLRSVDDALISLHREGTISLDNDTDVYVHSCDNWDSLVHDLAQFTKHVVILYSLHAQECKFVLPASAVPEHIAYFSLVADENVLESFIHEIKDGAEYRIFHAESPATSFDNRNTIMMICLIVFFTISMSANLVIAMLGCCGRLLWRHSVEKKTQEALAGFYAQQLANPPRCTDPSHRKPPGSSCTSEEFNTGLLPQYTCELKTPNYN